jgi:hypothetical protein
MYLDEFKFYFKRREEIRLVTVSLSLSSSMKKAPLSTP